MTLHDLLVFIAIFSAGFLVGYVLKLVLLQRQLRPGGELRRKVEQETKERKTSLETKQT